MGVKDIHGDVVITSGYPNTSWLVNKRNFTFSVHFRDFQRLAGHHHLLSLDEWYNEILRLKEQKTSFDKNPDKQVESFHSLV